MSSFSAGVILPDADPITADRPIVNDGWFPDVDMATLRKAARIRDDVTFDRLRGAIVGAIITVGNDLTAWQANHRAQGRLSLGAVPSPLIDGQSRLTHLYARAILGFAKADLVEGYRDTDLTAAGQRAVEDLDPSVAELRRDALHAIRDMLATSRTTVELI